MGGNPSRPHHKDGRASEKQEVRGEKSDSESSAHGELQHRSHKRTFTAWSLMHSAAEFSHKGLRCKTPFYCITILKWNVQWTISAGERFAMQLKSSHVICELEFIGSYTWVKLIWLMTQRTSTRHCVISLWEYVCVCVCCLCVCVCVHEVWEWDVCRHRGGLISLSGSSVKPLKPLMTCHRHATQPPLPSTPYGNVSPLWPRSECHTPVLPALPHLPNLVRMPSSEAWV